MRIIVTQVSRAIIRALKDKKGLNYVKKMWNKASSKKIKPMKYCRTALAGGKRTYPGEAEAVDSVCEHVAEEGGVGVQGGEVGVHVGALPVGHLQSREMVPLLFAYLDYSINVFACIHVFAHKHTSRT